MKNEFNLASTSESFESDEQSLPCASIVSSPARRCVSSDHLQLLCSDRSPANRDFQQDSTSDACNSTSDATQSGASSLRRSSLDKSSRTLIDRHDTFKVHRVLLAESKERRDDQNILFNATLHRKLKDYLHLDSDRRLIPARKLQGSSSGSMERDSPTSSYFLSNILHRFADDQQVRLKEDRHLPNGMEKEEISWSALTPENSSRRRKKIGRSPLFPRNVFSQVPPRKSSLCEFVSRISRQPMELVYEEEDRERKKEKQKEEEHLLCQMKRDLGARMHPASSHVTDGSESRYEVWHSKGKKMYKKKKKLLHKMSDSTSVSSNSRPIDSKETSSFSTIVNDDGVDGDEKKQVKEERSVSKWEPEKIRGILKKSSSKQQILHDIPRFPSAGDVSDWWRAKQRSHSSAVASKSLKDPVYFEDKDKAESKKNLRVEEDLTAMKNLANALLAHKHCNASQAKNLKKHRKSNSLGCAQSASSSEGFQPGGDCASWLWSRDEFRQDDTADPYLLLRMLAKNNCRALRNRSVASTEESASTRFSNPCARKRELVSDDDLSDQCRIKESLSAPDVGFVDKTCFGEESNHYTSISLREAVDSEINMARCSDDVEGGQPEVEVETLPGDDCYSTTEKKKLFEDVFAVSKFSEESLFAPDSGVSIRTQSQESQRLQDASSIGVLLVSRLLNDEWSSLINNSAPQAKLSIPGRDNVEVFDQLATPGDVALEKMDVVSTPTAPIQVSPNVISLPLPAWQCFDKYNNNEQSAMNNCPSLTQDSDLDKFKDKEDSVTNHWDCVASVCLTKFSPVEENGSFTSLLRTDALTPIARSTYVQTLETQLSTASTSVTDLENSKYKVASSSCSIDSRHLTKHHNLVSVPLSSAPLTSYHPSYSDDHKVNLNYLKKRRKGCDREKASFFSILPSLATMDDSQTDFPSPVVDERQDPSNVSLEADGSCDGDSENLFKAKVRKPKSKKLFDKTERMRFKYFECRNKNNSFRNLNQNCVHAKQSDSVKSRKWKLSRMEAETSSSTEDDLTLPRGSPVETPRPVEADRSANGLNSNEQYFKYISQGKYNDALEVTFDKDFSVLWEDPWSGERALVCAVVKFQYEIVDRLLRLGSILDAPDFNGRTAFLASAIQVDCRSAWLLLSHGLEVVCVAPLKIAYGRSKSFSQFEKFLELTMLSGFCVGKDLKWFETVLKSNSSNKAEPEPNGLSQHLLDSCKQPQTLLMSCFIATRRHLSKMRKGRSIISSIQQLPLPVLLKRFLCMENVL